MPYKFFSRKIIIPVILFGFFSCISFISCDKNENQDTVFLTLSYEYLRPNSVVMKCEMETQDAWTISEKGICWSTQSDPTIYDNKIVAGQDTGDFYTMITELIPNTQYHFRAFYTYKKGTEYSTDYILPTPAHAPVEFAPAPVTYGTVTDIEGNQYKTIQIGTQNWMAENLKVKKYKNGVDIPGCTGNGEWGSQTNGAYCDYYNCSVNSDTYGRLYSWSAVDSPDSICPQGWHVPTDEEWKKLEMFLGMSQSAADATGERGTDQGIKIMATTDDHWINGASSTNNSSGFTALPGGYRDISGEYKKLEKTGCWWTSSEKDSEAAWERSLYRSTISRNTTQKKFGNSVRCIQN